MLVQPARKKGGSASCDNITYMNIKRNGKREGRIKNSGGIERRPLPTFSRSSRPVIPHPSFISLDTVICCFTNSIAAGIFDSSMQTDSMSRPRQVETNYNYHWAALNVPLCIDRTMFTDILANSKSRLGLHAEYTLCICSLTCSDATLNNGLYNGLKDISCKVPWREKEVFFRQLLLPTTWITMISSF